MSLTLADTPLECMQMILVAEAHLCAQCNAVVNTDRCPWCHSHVHPLEAMLPKEAPECSQAVS